MKENVAGILSQLLGKFDKVPTYVSLCSEWDDYVKAQSAEDGETRQIFRRFLLDKNRRFVGAINLPYLTDLSQKVQMAINRLPDLTFDQMRLKSQEPSTAEVNQAITQIYMEIQTLVKYTEECMHYIGVLKHAITYLDCWKKSINELVLDEDVCPVCFGNLTDRKRFSDRMTADADAHLNLLKTHQRGLAEKSDKVLRPRQNMLLRADSALRLLTKMVEIEKGPGWVGGDTQPVHEGSDGFNVEKV